MQAGLSWWTIWLRRDAFRAAFDDFDPEAVASFGEDRIVRLLGDAGIIRNRAKINAIVANARAALALRPEFDGLSGYLWSFVGGAPMVNRWPRGESVPAVAPPAPELSAGHEAAGL